MTAPSTSPLSRLKHKLAQAKLAQSVAISFFARGLTLLSTLILVPLCIHALGLEGYGKLAAILSITTFFAFGDLGLGMTLMNKIAYAKGRNAWDSAKKYTTQTFFMTTAIALAGVVIGGILFFWNQTASLNLLSNYGEDQASLIILACCLSLIGVPLSLTNRILQGLQRIPAAQMWSILGRVAVVLAAGLGAYLSVSVFSFTLLIVGAPLLVSALATYIFFKHERPDLCPAAHLYTSKGLSKNLSTGLQMFALQLCAYLDIGADALIVAHYMGPQAAAELDIITKLFVYVPALTSVGLTPLWPALAEAHASENHHRRKKIIKTANLVIPIVSAVSGLFLLWQHTWLIEIWTGKHIVIAPLITQALFAYAVFAGMASFQSIELNARGILGKQIVISLALGGLSLGAKIACASQGFLAGIPLSLALFCVLKIALVHIVAGPAKNPIAPP